MTVRNAETPATPTAPAPAHPAVAARDEDGKLVVNTRTLTLAFLVLLGGGGTSAGFTFLRPAVPQAVVDDIAEARESAASAQALAQETKTAVRNVDATLADVRNALTRIDAALQQANERNGLIVKTLDDHESRLRAVERKLR
jgi:septal ring factor EnvC (AmiA/AmiB activator)